jgi:SAM-dependent methyltransferase
VGPTLATTIKMSDKNQHGGVIGTVHDRFIFSRRTRVLADHLASVIPSDSHVLDVGCGDGTIDFLIRKRRLDVDIEGIDPLLRRTTHIPVRPFDGENIPCPDRSFDVVMFVDVLHHTADPKMLLREGTRVGKTVLIKDHFSEGFLADETLRLMDWVGNARHGVPLPYNYWSKSEWIAAFDELGLHSSTMKFKLNLYPIPLSWIFDRSLHFIALCERGNNPNASSFDGLSSQI